MSLLLAFSVSCDNRAYKQENIKNEVFISKEWGAEAIGYNSPEFCNVKIGVIDVNSAYQGYNIGSFDIYNSENFNKFGHGTYTVALICKLLPNAQILSINIADDNGKITEQSLCLGIEYAVKNGCDIINLSLGTQYDYSKIKTAIDNAIENNCIVVAAAGNDYRDKLDYPAGYDQVISVISRGIDNIDNTSNNVSIYKKSFSAPDSVIFNNNIIIDGSSIATVYVTAIVASVKSAIPRINANEMIDLLKQTSVFSTEYSYGMINYNRILSKIN